MDTMFYCDTCCVASNSLTSWNDHLRGKEHARKLRRKELELVYSQPKTLDAPPAEAKPPTFDKVAYCQSKVDKYSGLEQNPKQQFKLHYYLMVLSMLLLTTPVKANSLVEEATAFSITMWAWTLMFMFAVLGICLFMLTIHVCRSLTSLTQAVVATFSAFQNLMDASTQAVMTLRVSLTKFLNIVQNDFVPSWLQIQHNMMIIGWCNFAVNVLSCVCSPVATIVNAFATDPLQAQSFSRHQTGKAKKGADSLVTLFLGLMSAFMVVLVPFKGSVKAYKFFEPVLKLLTYFPLTTYVVRFFYHFFVGDAKLDEVPPTIAKVLADDGKDDMWEYAMNYASNLPGADEVVKAATEATNRIGNPVKKEHDHATCDNECDGDECICICHNHHINAAVEKYQEAVRQAPPKPGLGSRHGDLIETRRKAIFAHLYKPVEVVTVAAEHVDQIPEVVADDGPVEILQAQARKRDPARIYQKTVEQRRIAYLEAQERMLEYHEAKRRFDKRTMEEQWKKEVI